MCHVLHVICHMSYVIFFLHRHAMAQNFADFAQTFEICMCKLENSLLPTFKAFLKFFLITFLCKVFKSGIVTAQQKSANRMSGIYL